MCSGLKEINYQFGEGKRERAWDKTGESYTEEERKEDDENLAVFYFMFPCKNKEREDQSPCFLSELPSQIWGLICKPPQLKQQKW